ncbi:MAG: hypothetical protein LBU57_01520, partial [Dysgonamonadaceae bacterium]|nr:hypothetical protein [Dysgonamonadaceae bacterium]
MKRILLIFVMVSFASVLVYGQGEMDAHMNSKTDLYGSARGIGMAGAFGSLGGDITSVAINPAGIGVYRSSEVLTTLNFSSANIKTDWNGSIDSDRRFKFNFDNIAYVGYFPMGDETVSSINFGFAYNRLKNFDRNYSSYGKGMQSSLSRWIAKDATMSGYTIDELQTRQGFDPYRNSGAPWIDILGFNGNVITPVTGGYQSYLFDNETVDPELSVTERGAVETYDFTLGTNFSEKLYLGVTFSLTDLHYSVSSLYSEFFGNTTDGFDLKNSLTENGSGYGVSLGAIFRPVDALRVGLSYHSPTWYNMSRSFWGDIYSEITLDDGIEKTEASAPSEDPYGVFDYKLQTPHRWTAGIAGIIGTKAIISLDYELTDYTAMDFREDNGSSAYYDNN